MGYDVISDVDALMYVVLSVAANHARWLVSQDVSRCRRGVEQAEVVITELTFFVSFYSFP